MAPQWSRTGRVGHRAAGEEQAGLWSPKRDGAPPQAIWEGGLEEAQHSGQSVGIVLIALNVPGDI